MSVLKKAAMMVVISKANSDDNELIRLIKKQLIQIQIAKSASNGAMANSIPVAVATPLPPLNRK